MKSGSSPVGIGRGRILSGLVGRGILESRSPWMHECEADALGLHLVYALFDFTDRGWNDDQLEAALAAAQRVGFSGLNITFPFKQAVIPLLDELSDGARAIGAVNTIAFREGKRIGHNTDVSGFAESFREGLPDVPRGAVLQMGCGGAGSATAHALLGDLGIGRIILSDTDSAKSENLRQHLAQRFGEDRVAVSSDVPASAAQVDGIVNASPVGMAKFPGLPLPGSAIEPRQWVADVVYIPLETALLAEARRKGCKTLHGGGMAVHQAAEAFEIITDHAADRARMGASFAAFVAEQGAKSAAA